MRRLSLAFAVLALAAVIGQVAASAKPKAEDPRPNLIVIVTDDQDDALFSHHLMPQTFALFRDGQHSGVATVKFVSRVPPSNSSNVCGIRLRVKRTSS